MKDNLSPEEKLLNLIKGHITPVSAPALKQDASKDKKAPSPAKLDLKYSTRSFVNRYSTFPYAKRLILALTGVSFIYLAAALAYPLFGLKEIKLPQVLLDNPKSAQSVLELEKKTKPYESYLKDIGQRQIFSTSLAQEETGPALPADADLIKSINLVGIISGDNPQAVIEDKKANKTSYLSIGQFIGGLQIENIKEGCVILNYKGQKYELYL